MSTLATLNVVLNGDVGGFLKAMKESEGQASSSSNIISRALGGIGDVVALGAKVAVAGIAAVIGAATTGVVAFQSWGKQLDDLSDVLGTTADESAGLVVAIRTVGGDVGALTGQMSKFAKGALESGKSLTPVQQELKALGINIHEVGKTSTVMGTALPAAKLTEFKDKLITATARLHDMEAAYAKSKAPTEMATLNLSKQRDLVASLTDKLGAGGKTIARTIGTEGPLKASSQLLEEVSTKLAAMPDGLEKTRIMTMLFGKSGKDLSDTLKALANGGLEEAADKAYALGLAIGEDGVNKSIEFGKSFETVKLALEGVAVSIGSVIMPVILPLIQKFSEWAVSVMPQVRDAIAAAFTWIQNNVGPIIQGVITWLQTAIAWVRSNWPQIQQAITDTFERARAIIEPIINAISSFIQSVFGAIATFVQTNGADIKNFLSTTWETIRGILEGIWNIISTIIQTVFGGIATFIQTHGTEIQQILQTAWDAVKSIIETVLGVIRAIINTVMALIKGDWTGVWNGIKQIAETIWGILRDGWNLFWAGIGAILNAAGDLIRRAWEALWGGIKAFFIGIWDAIRSFFIGAINGVIDLINGLIDAFNDSLGQLFGKLNRIPHVAMEAELNLTPTITRLPNLNSALMTTLGPGGGTGPIDQRSFTLNVYESGSTTDVIHDFELLRALAGR